MPTTGGGAAVCLMTAESEYTLRHSHEGRTADVEGLYTVIRLPSPAAVQAAYGVHTDNGNCLTSASQGRGLKGTIN